MIQVPLPQYVAPFNNTGYGRDSLANLLWDVMLIDEEVLEPGEFIKSLQIRIGMRPQRYDPQSKRPFLATTSATIELFDRNYGFLESRPLFAMAGQNKTVFTIRWNWDDRDKPLDDAPGPALPAGMQVVSGVSLTDGSGNACPTFLFSIGKCEGIEYTDYGATHRYALIPFIVGARRDSLSRQPLQGYAQFKASTLRYSDMVLNALASPNVAMIDQCIVQDSHGLVDYDVNIEADETTWDFIQRLAKDAVFEFENPDGSKGYEHGVAYVDEAGWVHFHGERYDWRPHRSGMETTRLWRYIYHKDHSGEVISFRPKDEIALSAFYRGGQAVYHAVDSENGEPLQFTANQQGEDGGVRNDESVAGENEPDPYEKDGPPPTNPTETNISPLGLEFDEGVEVRHVPGISKKQALQQARRFHAGARSMMLAAEMEVKGTHNVLPGDYISLRYFDHLGERHYFSGLYLVMEVFHNVEGGQWKTSFELQRRGYRENAPDTLRVVTSVKEDVPRGMDTDED